MFKFGDDVEVRDTRLGTGCWHPAKCIQLIEQQCRVMYSCLHKTSTDEWLLLEIVSLSCVRPVQPPCSNDEQLKILSAAKGCEVEILTHDAWYSVEFVDFNVETGKYLILSHIFDPREREVSTSEVRLVYRWQSNFFHREAAMYVSFQCDMRVEVYRTNAWYSGCIANVKHNQCIIRLDADNTECKVDRFVLRPEPPATPATFVCDLCIGSHVQIKDNYAWRYAVFISLSEADDDMCTVHVHAKGDLLIDRCSVRPLWIRQGASWCMYNEVLQLTAPSQCA